MGIKVELDEDLERRFRELAMKKFGYAKGSIKKATESAIRQWTANEFGLKAGSGQRQQGTKSGADLLVGLLKNTRHRSSVEEQHAIGKLWAKVAEERSQK